jgi:outer membrane protein OmpA-like peptidoglycan-associated protein
MLTRMRGCMIGECSKKDYDAAELVIGEELARNSVEGEVEIIDYGCPQSMSMLMMARNFENAVKGQGFKTVFSGLGNNGASVYTARKGDNWASIETHEGPGYKQIFVLNKAMEQQMVASVEDMEAEIAKTGQCSIYGILFDTGKATIQPDSEKCLQEVASLLTKNAAWKMRIEGHTDNVGGKDANLKLSQARADAVRAWLTSHGIAASRLTTQGLGDSKPVADNATDDGKAKNRRVALVKL